MYVIGTIRSTSVTPASDSQHSSTWSRSAMSAIEQPAFRSGRTTRWCSPVRMSADSAMKCTPQKTMSVALIVVGRETRQLERVAASVRPLDDFGALVVMPEDEELRAERRLGGGDPLVDLLGRREGVPVRQEGLESQHGSDPFREAPVAAGGDSLVAHRGVVGPGTDMWPECQAGLRGSLTPAHPSLIHDRLGGSGVRPALPAPLPAPRRRALRGRPDRTLFGRDGAEQVPDPPRRCPPVPPGRHGRWSSVSGLRVRVPAGHGGRDRGRGRRKHPVHDRAAHVVAAGRRPGDRGRRRLGMGSARRDRLLGARPPVPRLPIPLSPARSALSVPRGPRRRARPSATSLRGRHGAHRRVLRQGLAARAGAHARRSARLASARRVRCVVRGRADGMDRVGRYRRSCSGVDSARSEGLGVREHGRRSRAQHRGLHPASRALCVAGRRGVRLGPQFARAGGSRVRCARLDPRVSRQARRPGRARRFGPDGGDNRVPRPLTAALAAVPCVVVAVRSHCSRAPRAARCGAHVRCQRAECWVARSPARSHRRRHAGSVRARRAQRSPGRASGGAGNPARAAGGLFRRAPSQLEPASEIAA